MVQCLAPWFSLLWSPIESIDLVPFKHECLPLPGPAIPHSRTIHLIAYLVSQIGYQMMLLSTMLNLSSFPSPLVLSSPLY